MGNLTSVPTIRVAPGLFNGFPGFVGFTGIADGLPCALVPTLGLLGFASGSGEEIIGHTPRDILGMV